jgi:vanillate/3-O-methylgallate O-demethylase
LPAIYHGDEMRPNREWLTTNHLETIGSLGGSFVSDRIEDYYVDPIEVGYGNVVDWNRDFIGRDGLERKRDSQRRVKRSLLWYEDDVMEIIRSSLFAPEGQGGKFIAVPSPMHATFEADSVLLGGELVGLSNWSAYSPNAGSFLSLAIIDLDYAEPGTEVTLLWGEPNSLRPSVEKHQLREIRATVAPAPYFEKVIKTGEQ